MIAFAVLLSTAVAQVNQVEITVEGAYRYIRSNGVPNHPIGEFPNPHNPNTMSPKYYAFKVPANPKVAARTTPLRMQDFGVAINGVPFDPFAAEFWNRDWNSGWQFEPMSGAIDLGLDQNNAHVQPDGAYHYHSVPNGLLDTMEPKEGMYLVGYAADGFPIYAIFGHSDPKNLGSPIVKVRSSYRLRKGLRPSGPGGEFDGTFVQDYEYVKGAGSLDECNGRFGVTPEYPAGIYHYYIIEEFPYIPRLFRGTPDISFERRGPPGGPGGPRGRGGPPPPGFPPPLGPGGPPPRGFPPPR